MKFSTFFTAALCSVSLLSAETFNTEADDQIVQCIHATSYSNSVVEYPFNGVNYPIRIITNPRQETLWRNGAAKPISYQLLMVGSIPLDLSWHLAEFIPQIHNETLEYFFDFGRSANQLSFTSLQPVYIAKQIEDPQNDRLVSEAFSSAHFVNKIVYYYLNNEYYQVRILHNPERKTFKAAKIFRLEFQKAPSEFSIYWSNKYGIMVDKAAPGELIDHLSKLTNATWKEWYLNFDVQNGTTVKFQRGHGRGKTIYSLDTWFNFTESFQ